MLYNPIALIALCLLPTTRGGADLESGVVVESVASDSQASKAGFRKGDVLLRWSHGERTGRVVSPWDLLRLELEEEPRGPVTIEGVRGSLPQTWTVESLFDGANKMSSEWGLAVEPQPSEPAPSQSGAVAAWRLLHEADRAADPRQAEPTDGLLERALEEVRADEPELEPIVLWDWASARYQHGDRPGAKGAFERSLDHAPDTLVAAASLTSLGVLALEENDRDRSVSLFRRALAIRTALAPDSRAVAMDLYSLGSIAYGDGGFDEARARFLESLAIRQRVAPASVDTAAALNALGLVAFAVGEWDMAEEYFTRGLGAVETLPPSVRGLGVNLTGLGELSFARGDVEKAEDYYRRSLALREQLYPGSVGVVRGLNRLAQVARTQGDAGRARDYGLRAGHILDALPRATVEADPALAADAYQGLGDTYLDLGDRKKAEDYLRLALAAAGRGTRDNLGMVSALLGLGQVVADRDAVEAETHMRRAVAIAEAIVPGGVYVATGLQELGDLLARRGERRAAMDCYARAVAIRESLVPGTLAHGESLAALGAMLRDERQPDEAAATFEKALDAFENQATNLGGSEEGRAQFRAHHLDVYKAYADLLVAQQQPERAFEVIERSRARSLLEMLAAAHVDVHGGAAPQLVARERQARARIATALRRRIESWGDEHRRAAVERELQALVVAYHEVEDEMRTSSPSYAALLHPRPLSAHRIQREVLDGDTLLLEYALGEEHSSVYAVTADAVTVHALPPRKEIEDAARAVYRALTTRGAPGRARTSRASTRLSRMVLAPLAAQMKYRRLLVVSDGALQYIPFAMLPAPGTSAAAAAGAPSMAPPLITDHEIVHLPSASVLALLRAGAPRSTPSGKVVAVVADPVFDTTDERVHGTFAHAGGRAREATRGSSPKPRPSLPSRVDRSLADVGLGKTGTRALARLPFSRMEARAILEVTPAGAGMEALDFEASRATVTSAALRQYRILHFATHGLMDSRHPELSGLVLSLVDAHGRAQDGFLGLEDIYNLDLAADLVVLSGCETGLGKDIQGEGLLSLTRGFLYAGASRVVASSWSVDDAATAELMGRFYRSMERDGMGPAAALREAQLEMWRQKRWSDPYYWGAFQLHGDWK
jgi:CHAT domain-containing protein/Tfp pilus assembly protein PilF